MIYAIRALGTDFIKFGKAKDVGKRYNDIQSTSPFELRIEAIADWPDYMERAIHKLLSLRGEWFSDSPLTQEALEWLRSDLLDNQT